MIKGPSSAVGDVSVSRQKWVDPQVIRERDVLLGNETVSRFYADRVWAKMVEQYEEVFEQLKIIEIEAFGENSYFHWKELGLSMGSDNSWGMEDAEAVEEDVGEDM